MNPAPEATGRARPAPEATGRARGANWSMLLAPGAGADRDQATLVALDHMATSAGGRVRRMDFAYRRAGKRAPDRPPVLIQAVVDEATALGGRAPLVLGGRSMGGRICSLAVAEDAAIAPSVGGVPVAGLLLVSYPLHPPGRPDKLRTDHFPAVSVPCLFVSGTRDAFGTRAEIEAATAAIPGPVTHHWVEGKDHSLRNSDSEVTEVAFAWLTGLGLNGADGPIR